MNKDIKIFVGEKEWDAWKKYSLTVGASQRIHEKEMPECEGNGITYSASVWVFSKNDINVVFHEVQHALSALFEFLGCEAEEEFKAFVAGYVQDKVYKWLQEDK